MDDIRLQNGSTVNNNINNNNNNDDLSMSINVNHVEISWHETPANQRVTPVLNQSCSLSPVLGRTSDSGTLTSSARGPGNRAGTFRIPPSASPAFSSASTSSMGSSVTPAVNRSPIPLNPGTPLVNSPNASLTSVSPTIPSVVGEVRPVVSQTGMQKVETVRIKKFKFKQLFSKNYSILYTEWRYSMEFWCFVKGLLKNIHENIIDKNVLLWILIVIIIYEMLLMLIFIKCV